MSDRAEVIAEHLARHLPPRANLLEIGAGKGHIAKQLEQATGASISLVDVVDYNETDLHLQVYDGSQLPFPDASFDYGLLVFVLHHTPDPLPVLREALRVSRWGVLVVENHVAGSLRRQVTRLIDSIPHWRYGVPVCHHALTRTDWFERFAQLPVHARLLEEFHMGPFWHNFIAMLEK